MELVFVQQWAGNQFLNSEKSLIQKKGGGEGRKRGPEMLSIEITAFHDRYATSSGENFQITPE